jgi:hypothetical protein
VNTQLATQFEIEMRPGRYWHPGERVGDSDGGVRIREIDYARVIELRAKRRRVDHAVGVVISDGRVKNAASAAEDGAMAEIVSEPEARTEVEGNR